MNGTLEVRRLSGALGAEVRGLTLGQVGPAEAEMVQSLLMEHLVLFFPEQYVTPEEHIAFGRHFGPVEGHPHLSNRSDYPEIFDLAASRGGVADEWHSDITFQPHPSVLAILNMVQCPEVGGDTLWANMYTAIQN